jgi:release factor glutamine methyltransferase
MKKILVGLIIPAIFLAWGYETARRSGVPQETPINTELSGLARLDLPGDPPASIEEWRRLEDFPGRVAQFKTVFWDPRDTESLRRLIRNASIVRGKTVLEIGTGTGLLALSCLKAGAARAVATDVNPAAIANATYNANLLGVADRLETRLSPLDRRGAYSTIGESERFDLIISNPPWENQTPGPINEYALYDQEFALLRSILSGLDKHLKPGGKALLAYGCVSAIETLQQVARECDLTIRTLDDRDLRSLPEVFLPGMLFEVAPLDRGPAL